VISFQLNRVGRVRINVENILQCVDNVVRYLMKGLLCILGLLQYFFELGRHDQNKVLYSTADVGLLEVGESRRDSMLRNAPTDRS